MPLSSPGVPAYGERPVSPLPCRCNGMSAAGPPMQGLPGGCSPVHGPQGPPMMSACIPDPAAIARQKEVYLKMLDEQLKQGISVLDQQAKYQRDHLSVQCDQQKKQFLMQLDQQMKKQEMVLTQQYNEQLLQLQMQAGTQKAALEQQAMHLSMEYEQRKAEEQMYRQQYEIEQQQREMAMRSLQEFQRVSGPLTQLPGPPPGPVLAPRGFSGGVVHSGGAMSPTPPCSFHTVPVGGPLQTLPTVASVTVAPPQYVGAPGPQAQFMVAPPVQ
eukprot:TRINITY_DN15079_c0_g1_i1.p1 TRINITY_DN15079_c0_g1~~TRINITY_DN15079_c0_g1_i1.p1  ORF type:complete len:303 (+),score=41.88 TRINITY_DN15079_c0_g1_i1:97-909(+)